MLALVCLTVAWMLLGLLTLTGSRRRGNGWEHAVVEGLMWPGAWVGWYVQDNRAAGREPFDGGTG